MSSANGQAAVGKLRLGTAPDSWGVWFPQDDKQTSWQRYLDEVAEAGYVHTELGPFGFLPNDPPRLKDELGSRGLTLVGGTAWEHLHHEDSWESTWAEFEPLARVLVALGAEHVVVLPKEWRDAKTWGELEPRQLDADGWKRLTSGMDRLGQVLLEEYGLKAQLHQHADTHIDTQENLERFLESTDPQFVNLCLDTGHIAYCGGDNLEIINKYPERIGYVHIKQAHPEMLDEIRAKDMPFGEACIRGAMCEPPQGIPEIPPVLDALVALDKDLFTIVEQDMYPCDPDAPLPIATRTRRYLKGCGSHFRAG